MVKTCVFLGLEEKATATVDGSEIPNHHLGCMKNTVINGMNYLSTGAGFLPSTVWTHRI